MKKKGMLSVIIIAAVIIGAVCPAMAKNLGVQMREGIYKEQMDGDLPGATDYLFRHWEALP